MKIVYCFQYHYLLNMNKDEKIQLLRDAIDIYPNFPKPGIIYR